MDVVIASAVRTAVGKAPRGALKAVRPDDLAAITIKEAIHRVPGLTGSDIEDVVLGCATPEAEQGLNVARMAALRAELPVECSAMTVNRYCASGLQAIAIAADQIQAGRAHAIVAGGVESMSHVPFQGYRIRYNPWLVDNFPGSYISMGLTAERVARHYSISREQMDQFSLESHKKALRAQEQGAFEEEIVPVPILKTTPKNGTFLNVESQFDKDEGPRADTTPERLAKLKPVFHAEGRVTAGNSSQTSDGAAACVVMSGERATQLGIKPLARFIAFSFAGCDPEEMGMGPVFAIPKVLKMTGLSLDRIDIIELNEAFAAQALAVISCLGLDPEKVNVNGGAISLGHPLGCTGAKLTATLLYEMRRRHARYGLVSMCVGGGMGAAGIFEAL
jgi:acetyl-CoA acyltransferase